MELSGHGESLKTIYRPIVIVLLLALVVSTQVQLWPLVLLSALNLLMRENFPFSHYPMYSALPEATFYLFLEDNDGRAVPAHDHLGVSAPWLKKRFISELKNHSNRNALRTEAEALRKTARALIGSFEKKGQGYALQMARLDWDDGQPVESVMELTRW